MVAPRCDWARGKITDLFIFMYVWYRIVQTGIDKYFKEFPDGGYWQGKNYGESATCPRCNCHP